MLVLRRYRLVKRSPLRNEARERERERERESDTETERRRREREREREREHHFHGIERRNPLLPNCS